MSGEARSKVALAVDVPLLRGLQLYRDLSDYVGFAKVGLSLFVEHGPSAVEKFRSLGAKVFLDLKMHDIPNTIERAAEQAGRLGVDLVTVHAGGGKAMLEAALAGSAKGASSAGHPRPRVLAVTVLTSLNAEDLAAVGVGGGAGQQVERLGALAVAAGIDGLVCSAREAAALKAKHPHLFLCTPGIRPSGSDAGDQARAETPGAAISAGSDLLVIGRPLYDAKDPRAAAERIARELADPGVLG